MLVIKVKPNMSTAVAEAKGNANTGFIKRVVVLSLVTVLVCSMFLFMWTQACYAVAIDGEVVGTVRHKEDVNTIIRNVEENVSGILGYEYHVDADVELKGTFIRKEDHIAEAVMGAVDEIGYMYILNVDGAAVAAAVSEEALSAAVDGIIAAYTIGEDCTVSIDNEITVTRGYVPMDSASETEDIIKYLDPANGSDHSLTVRTVATEVHQEPVPFEYEVQEDDQMYEGTRIVLVVGEDGVADVTEKAEYVNGQEITRTEINRVVVQQPVNEVATVGTMFRPAWASYGEYIWPCAGWITSDYGYRNVRIGSTYHKGLDIADYLGSEIYAADGGTVTYAGYWGDYGLTVEIEHDNGEITRYAHCHSLAVSKGYKVTRGEVIGYMGQTGNVSGVHLHFEIRVDGNAIDPLTRLP